MRFIAMLLAMLAAFAGSIDVRTVLDWMGIIINGMAIINDHPVSWTFAHVQPPGGLPKYYRHNVTGGPGGFVLEIHDFHSFGAAMTRKLITEIAGRAAPASYASLRCTWADCRPATGNEEPTWVR